MTEAIRSRHSGVVSTVACDLSVFARRFSTEEAKGGSDPRGTGSTGESTIRFGGSRRTVDGEDTSVVGLPDRVSHMVALVLLRALQSHGVDVPPSVLGSQSVQPSPEGDDGSAEPSCEPRRPQRQRAQKRDRSPTEKKDKNATDKYMHAMMAGFDLFANNHAKKENEAVRALSDAHETTERLKDRLETTERDVARLRANLDGDRREWGAQVRAAVGAEEEIRRRILTSRRYIDKRKNEGRRLEVERRRLEGLMSRKKV